MLETQGEKMQKTITKRKNGTLRVQQKCSGISKTDQSDKNMCDINSIMKNYVKSGILPNFKEKVAQYIDTTQIPSYIDAHKQITRANKLFEDLPSEIRKLMDNNPANLEKVIQNPLYKEKLLEYGILEEKSEDSSYQDAIKKVAADLASAKPTSDSASGETSKK